MLVSEVFRMNAKSPILTTLVGMVMLVKDVASKKALCPMLVTPAGIMTSPEH